MNSVQSSLKSHLLWVTPWPVPSSPFCKFVVFYINTRFLVLFAYLLSYNNFSFELLSTFLIVPKNIHEFFYKKLCIFKNNEFLLFCCQSFSTSTSDKPLGQPLHCFTFFGSIQTNKQRPRQETYTQTDKKHTYKQTTNRHIHIQLI